MRHYLEAIMPVSTISKLNSLGTNHICVGNDTIVFVHKAKNLAVTLDSDLSMDSHVSHIPKVT